jgi:hypothetical protein
MTQVKIVTRSSFKFCGFEAAPTDHYKEDPICCRNYYVVFDYDHDCTERAYKYECEPLERRCNELA